MTKNKIFSGIFTALALACPVAQADFAGDASTTITLRNFYFYRDYLTPGAPLDEAESWSQAGFLHFRSGYTEGAIGLGLDITGFGAVRLMGSFDNSGNLPTRRGSEKLVDGYGRAGATLKLRVSNSELKVGLLEPQLPVVFRDNTRVLRQTFQGALLTIGEFDKVKLTAGQLWETSVRASSNGEKIYLHGRPPTQRSDSLSFVGADAQWNNNWSSSYWFARLDDIYDQHYLGSNFSHPLSENTRLFGTLSYFDTSASGRKISGRVDNRALGLRLGLAHAGHRLSASYQNQSGQDDFPVLFGYTPQLYLPNWSAIIGFWWAGEHSWQARYDYDFAAAGIPGLTLIARYTRGAGALGAPPGAGEYERDIDIGYTVQAGPLKDLSFLVRTVGVRSYWAGKFDERRFIVEYKFNL